MIVAILPLLAFAAFMIANDSQAQRAAYREQLQATSRAASFAIDAEIARQEGILKGLSAAPELKNHDWRAFHDLAKAAIADEPGERVNLIEPSGMFVMSTLAPFGTDLGPSGAPDAIRAVVETRRPVVSSLFIGVIDKAYTVSVYVPVIENGSVTHILSIAIAPARILRVLRSSISSEGGARRGDRPRGHRHCPHPRRGDVRGTSGGADSRDNGTRVRGGCLRDPYA